ncbi:ribosomal-protein-alanine N-acetyltransferase [Breznakia sp. PF5-3]|uniref:GNAT family N-acetyltransferase n=1 Tax=unclassified Breznakia TaxID=2623764 RepID=UPI00240674B4|nr:MULTISPECIES: GNAT family N-acetyltransferase [unclassified Breznakia]MDF9825468.1 ribosomal-protein-alanine N-acetyltransferase [Breznakia sp. PM6-1]MDF9836353.1 ribosomal-protein-alanine N-acetyltransferase [Breznakia sp. PF5-3]
MKLESRRCTIREFKRQDIDAFMEYRNNDSWMKYQGFKNLTKKQYEEALLKDLDFKEGAQLVITHTRDAVVIGDIYLKAEDDSVWIGYTIHPTYARQGYVKEALTTIFWWLKNQGIHKVKASVLKENVNSIALLKKLGFLFSGIEEDEEIYLKTL